MSEMRLKKYDSCVTHGYPPPHPHGLLVVVVAYRAHPLRLAAEGLLLHLFVHLHLVYRVEVESDGEADLLADEGLLEVEEHDDHVLGLEVDEGEVLGEVAELGHVGDVEVELRVGGEVGAGEAEQGGLLEAVDLVVVHDRLRALVLRELLEDLHRERLVVLRVRNLRLEDVVSHTRQGLESTHRYIKSTKEVISKVTELSNLHAFGVSILDDLLVP